MLEMFALLPCNSIIDASGKSGGIWTCQDGDLYDGCSLLAGRPSVVWEELTREGGNK